MLMVCYHLWYWVSALTDLLVKHPEENAESSLNQKRHSSLGRLENDDSKNALAEGTRSFLVDHSSRVRASK